MRRPALVGSAALLSLFLVCGLLHADEKSKHTARWQDLLITVVAVEASEEVPQPYVPGRPFVPREGYYFVRVRLVVNNQGRRAATADFAPRLKASFGLEYRPFRQTRYEEEPRVHELLPGEEARGSYTFEVKKGAEPLELRLGERRPRIRLQGLLPKPPDSPQEQ